MRPNSDVKGKVELSEASVRAEREAPCHQLES